MIIIIDFSNHSTKGAMISSFRRSPCTYFLSANGEQKWNGSANYCKNKLNLSVRLSQSSCFKLPYESSKWSDPFVVHPVHSLTIIKKLAKLKELSELLYVQRQFTGSLSQSNCFKPLSERSNERIFS